jgi:DNA-binding MarR family transcriptional regulator
MDLQRELDLDLPFSDVYHEAVLNIVRTSVLLAAVGADLFRQFGLTEAQFNIMAALKYRERDLTQSELSRRLVVTRASVTSVLDRLETKELVERVQVEGNRRIHHVQLTKTGEKLLEKVEPAYRDAVREALGGLKESQCRELVNLLEQVRDQLRPKVLDEKGRR